MRATYIYGPGNVHVINVPDPVIQQPTDATVRVVRACICGSDLRLHAIRSGAAMTSARCSSRGSLPECSMRAA